MKTPNLELKERQMLELLANAASTRVIARRMGYSEGTVRVYLHNLYKKIGVRNRTEALLWHLERARPAEARVAAPRSAGSRAEETFGDVALRDGLLCTLGVMESFLGPYGRVWEVGARLKGAELDERTLELRDETRTLWRALLQGTFGYAKGLHDDGLGQRLLDAAPSEAALLACLLLIGGYSHAGEEYLQQLSRARKGGRSLGGRELSLLRSLRDAIYGRDDEAVAAIHQLAADKSAHAVKHLALVALYHVYLQRRDAARARDTANVIWSEAEVARRQLEAMGVRPLAREAVLPRGGKVSSREKVAAGG
jgi:DNA-binding CsgD family transcriptional regulator